MITTTSSRSLSLPPILRPNTNPYKQTLCRCFSADSKQAENFKRLDITFLPPADYTPTLEMGFEVSNMYLLSTESLTDSTVSGPISGSSSDTSFSNTT
tara:strand:- start:384 stop:677 length:294 start_codon:yes stop_codon:yes gene_type:complete